MDDRAREGFAEAFGDQRPLVATGCGAHDPGVNAYGVEAVAKR
ncbi:hypothetical protein [Streptomyces sp. ISL-98]|nr:hypothetical protein [Streptomyces sp. ISL-98]